MFSTRREWLAGCGAAVLGAAERYRPRLAVQTYIWMQQLEREHKSLDEGVSGALAATRRAGFRRVELMGNFLGEAVRARTFQALETEGLEVPIVYCGGPMHEAAAAETTTAAALKLADTAKRTGARILNFNPDPKPNHERKTDDELAQQARAVTELARQLEEKRFQLLLHHHSPEMAEGAREWRHLLQNTELPLCLDLNWIYRGGGDPLALLTEAGPRVRSLHLRNSHQGVWNEDLSAGDVDYPKIAEYLKGHAYSGYLVVELAYEPATQITRSLEDDLRRSREYARDVFGIES